MKRACPFGEVIVAMTLPLAALSVLLAGAPLHADDGVGTGTCSERLSDGLYHQVPCRDQPSGASGGASSAPSGRSEESRQYSRDVRASNALTDRGTALYGQGRYEEALQAYLQAEALVPGYLAPTIRMTRWIMLRRDAAAAAKTDDYDRALALLEQARQVDPDNQTKYGQPLIDWAQGLRTAALASAIDREGIDAFKRGDYAAAAMHFRDAIQHDPSVKQYKDNLAAAEARLKGALDKAAEEQEAQKFAEVKGELKKNIILKGASVGLETPRRSDPAAAAWKANDLEGARKDYESKADAAAAAGDRKGEAAYRLLAAELLHESGDDAAAIRELKKAKSLSSDLPLASLLLAKHHFDHGDIAAAKKELRAYLDREPDDRLAAKIMADLKEREKSGASPKAAGRLEPFPQAIRRHLSLLSGFEALKGGTAIKYGGELTDIDPPRLTLDRKTERRDRLKIYEQQGAAVREERAAVAVKLAEVRKAKSLLPDAAQAEVKPVEAPKAKSPLPDAAQAEMKPAEVFKAKSFLEEAQKLAGEEALLLKKIERLETTAEQADEGAKTLKAAMDADEKKGKP